MFATPDPGQGPRNSSRPRAVHASLVAKHTRSLIQEAEEICRAAAELDELEKQFKPNA